MHRSQPGPGAGGAAPRPADVRPRPDLDRQVEESLLELKKQYTIIIVPTVCSRLRVCADRAGFADLVEYREGGESFTSPKDKRTEDYITGCFG